MPGKSPEQALYDAVFAISLQLGYDTYDDTPADVPYPFVYIGEQSYQESRTKSGPYGTIQQTVHIYGLYSNRSGVTAMERRIKDACRRIGNKDGYYFIYRDATGQMIKDVSTSDVLWHNVMDLEFRYN